MYSKGLQIGLTITLIVVVVCLIILMAFLIYRAVTKKESFVVPEVGTSPIKVSYTKDINFSDLDAQVQELLQ